MSDTNEIIKDMPKGILNWYPFQKGSSALCIENGSDVLTHLLKEKGLTVLQNSLRLSAGTDFIEQNRQKFDYVVAIGILETSYEPIKMLQRWKQVLKPEGKLLLGMDNRMGIRYFCGDREPFTESVFNGIEDYYRQDRSNLKAMGGRLYGKGEIEDLLDAGGFIDRKFYSVLPNLDMPQLIYAEDYLPREELSMRYFPMYRCPDTVFLNEEYLYSGLIRNGLFHQMANSYLVECTDSREFADVRHVTLSMDRGPENAFATVIRTDEQVYKQPLYQEGLDKLENLYNNLQDLKERGLNVVELKVQNGLAVMPYIDAPVGNKYMQELLLRDKEEFIQKMDEFRDLILQSSEHMGETKQGIILERGYIDLVPLNCFYQDNKFVFYDQEFYYENYPANAIIHRALAIIYAGDPTRESILPFAFFKKRYQLGDQDEIWGRYSQRFTDKLRNQRELEQFNMKHMRNGGVVMRNRMRIDETEMIRCLKEKNCFEGLDNKIVYLFGAGNWTRKFLAFYQYEYEIRGIFDNSSDKWGTELNGIPIEPIENLAKTEGEDYRIIICVSQCEAIYRQLIEMGIPEDRIARYDAARCYPGRPGRMLQIVRENSGISPKKYRVGYVAGVFDLYHIGHLNMFRRAKEQCDYLIVGVTSDKYVFERKQKAPFIPFEERLVMVQSCKYVDEAVPIPFEYGGTVEAFQKYHFDVQFSGSDYVNDPWWLEQQKFLRAHGSDLVFFPYTQQTNSTKIKALIDKGLM